MASSTRSLRDPVRSAVSRVAKTTIHTHVDDLIGSPAGTTTWRLRPCNP